MMQAAGVHTPRRDHGEETPVPAAPRRRDWLYPALAAAAVGLLLYLWSRNYNVLGDFFDYSILASACGHLHAGHAPYRDFITPLQSLTIYLCYGAELLFGPRYLSLGCANLGLGLGFFFLVLGLLKAVLPKWPGLLAATALCAATFFHHGILWYNSAGMLLLTALVLLAARVFREGRLGAWQLGTLCLLVFLSGMNKMNFHVFGLGLVLGILLLAASQRRVSGLRFAVAVALLLFRGVLGPLAEIGWCGVTPRVFWENVFGASHGRVGRGMQLLNPRLYFEVVCDSYPDNWSSGVYFKALLIYGWCLYLILRSRAAGGFALKRSATLAMSAFFGCSLLVTVTNWETQWLTASFVLVGLLATFVMFAPWLRGLPRFGLLSGISILAVFFLVGGGLSAWLHSRERYG